MSRPSAAPRRRGRRAWTGGYRPLRPGQGVVDRVGVVLALAVVLTILFSSPDDQPSTIQSWARTDPVDFVTTAVTELDGTSGTASYGPPYNHTSDGQHIAFIYLAEVARGQPSRSTRPRTSCSSR